MAAADERGKPGRPRRWVLSLVVLEQDQMRDDFFEPARDDFKDWESSVQREWEKWERLEERGDLDADWWPPKEDDE